MSKNYFVSYDLDADSISFDQYPNIVFKYSSMRKTITLRSPPYSKKIKLSRGSSHTIVAGETRFNLKVTKRTKRGIIVSIEPIFAEITIGKHDADMEILLRVGDDQLKALCAADKYYYKICQSNEFWRRRLSLIVGFDLPKKEYNYREIYKDVVRGDYGLLVLFSIHGVIEVVKFLGEVKKGSNIDAQKNSALQLAALQLAAQNGHLEVVKFLVEKGADIGVQGDSALGRAALRGHLEVVKFLVDNDADIHARGDSALGLAAFHGHLEVVKFLVDNDADIHALDDLALGVAAENGHLEVVKFLVENDADIHALDDFALRVAAENGHLEVAKFLVENGADIHTLDDLALRWAARNRHLKIVKYLKKKTAEGY